MKFLNQNTNTQAQYVNPQTAAFMLSYGFSGKKNSFQWARTSQPLVKPAEHQV